MRTLRIIKIFLLTTVRLILPSVVILSKYWVLIWMIYILEQKSNTQLIKIMIKWMLTISESLIDTPLALYRQDKFTWIAIGFVFLVIIWGLIFPKKSKLHFIWEDIKNILWDLTFSLIYLFGIVIDYIKIHNLDTLNENINFYFKTWILRWINFFRLNKLEKKLLRSWNGFNISLYDRINTYFKGHYNCSVTSFIDNNETKVIRLLRPQNMKWIDIMKLNKDDLIFALWYSIDKYSLDISVWNEIELIFTFKNTGKILNINDFINSFKPDTYNFWLDSMWNLVSIPINYSHANHIGVYGLTGHGKSVFTSSLIYGLYKKNNYRFYVIDPKGDFYWAKWVKNISYSSNLKDIVGMVSEIRMSMEKTQNELNSKQSRNISEYLKLEDRKEFVKPTFILIEEFSYLLDLVWDIWKDERAEFLSNIKNIVQVWRSSWFSLILSLQKPISEAIWSTIVKDMIKPVSFKSSWSWEVIVFWEKTWLELDKLDIWEAVYFDNGKYKKFKSFYIDKSDLDRLIIDHKDDEIGIVGKYYRYSKSIDSFKFEEALKFWLSRTQFDNLSKELQTKWILVKSSDNHLHFSK